jgi:hypothetical protein
MNSNFGVLGKKIDTLSQKLDMPVPNQPTKQSRGSYCAVPMDARYGIIEAVRVAGQQKITITSVLGDSHAFQCAIDWISVFKEAGWQVDGPHQAIFTRPMTGLFVSVGPGIGREQGKPVSLNELPVQAATLIQVLQVNHIPVQLNLDERMSPDMATMILGGEP